MRKLLFLFPLLSTLAQAEWKKHVVTEAKGMINSAVAADWNADGKIDVIASLDGKVVLFTGPDWKKRRLAFMLYTARSTYSDSTVFHITGEC